MNPTTSPPDAVIRDIPLSRLVLAPENVRKTAAHESAQAQLDASIRSHGLLENLVARADGTDDNGNERFAVVAGGRRLGALQALADEGAIDADHPVPCRIAPNGQGGELSLAENVVRVAMHPADQVVAFSALADDGVSVAAIAARFGISERIVEQRLRLGNAAPELLEAYRADAIGLETLKAFAVTADHERQLAVWAQVSAQDYGPSAWQVKRLLTEERVPASAALARFVGVDAYEAAGGAVMRDLFADEHENGVWLEAPALLNELALNNLTAVTDELSTRWKWAEAQLEVDRSAAARYGRIHPRPGEPTDEESTEIEQLRTRHDELVNLDEDEWTEELNGEAEAIQERLDAIEQAVKARDQFRREDIAIAGCIATVGRDGTLQLIQGLVKPEDMPKPAAADAGARSHDAGAGTATGTVNSGRVDPPGVSAPLASPPDPRAQAREQAGVGLGLGDDLRAIRTALVKAHLAGDFEATFDLMVFQLARAVFANGYTASYRALDIAFNETADRPTTRMNDEDFAAWSPGEAMLADWSHLPFGWMEADDDAACFAALRALPRADKEKLFAAAVARTVKGQLAFEHDARPELEATVARLGIDFARHVRPSADLLWSRLRKDRILAVARDTLGPAWTSARSKYKKVDLARAMEEAFAAGSPPVGIAAEAHAAALAWTPPGFQAFDAGGDAADDAAADAGTESAGTDGPAPSAEATSSNGAQTSPGGPDEAPAHTGHAVGNGHDASARKEADPGPVNGNGKGEVPAADPSASGGGPLADNGEAEDVPEFLRRVAQ